MTDGDDKLPRDRGPLRLVSEDEGAPPKPDPWERQPGETKTAFEAFRHYVEIPPADRSVFEACLRAGVKMDPNGARYKKRNPPRSWAKWSRENSWRERAAAWDSYCEELEHAERKKVMESKATQWAERRQEQRDSEWEMAAELVQKARDILSWPLERVETIEHYDEPQPAGAPKTIVIHPAKWSMRDAATFVDLADKIARLAAEMATSRDQDRDEKEAAAESGREMLAKILQDPGMLQAAELLANAGKVTR